MPHANRMRKDAYSQIIVALSLIIAGAVVAGLASVAIGGL